MSAQVYDELLFRAVRTLDRELPENPSMEQLVNLVANYFYCNYRGQRILVMEYLMKNTSPEMIQEIVSYLGFTNLQDTIDTFYDLLWYYNIASLDKGEIDEEQKAELSGYTTEQLMDVAFAEEEYTGYTSKAALLFAITTGYICPIPRQNPQRTKDVTEYSPSAVWDLCYYFYDFTNPNFNPQSLSPYQFLLTVPDSTIENIAEAFNENTTEILMNHMGIVTPRNFEGNLTQFIFNELKNYERIFNRNSLDRTNVIDLKRFRTTNERFLALSLYTLKELIDFYEPSRENWNGRQDLQGIIIGDSLTTGNSWSKRNKWCDNDDTMNIIEARNHGEMNKNDPTDPTYSYGAQRKYSCYQADELEAAWGDVDGTWTFRVPDWSNENPNKPATFPRASMPRLREILENEIPQTDPVIQLREKIDTGLASLLTTNTTLLELRTRYNLLPREEKDQVDLYVAWLFQLAMIFRYWKGLGHDWPVKWSERANARGQYVDADSNLREEKAHLQFNVKEIILRNASQDVINITESIPLIREIGEDILVSTTPVSIILGLAQNNEYCLADASDRFLATSRLVYTVLTGNDINDLLRDKLRVLLEIELAHRLTIASQPWEEREQEITQILRQGIMPSHFDPVDIEVTRHVDPEAGRQLTYN